jgi:hypothetical protein
MARFRLLAALMAVFVIALPAASLADSAGDNQYQDPFANTQPKHSGTNTAPTTTTPPATSTPAPTTQTQPTSAGTSNADPASTDGQLPRTGLDLRLVGGLGVLLLGGGLLLRRRLASDR